MDVLTDILKTAGTTLRVDEILIRKMPWRLESTSAERVVFYALAEGSCQLSLKRKSTILKGGDIAFVSHDSMHVLDGVGHGHAKIITGTLTFLTGIHGIDVLGIPPVLVLHPLADTTTSRAFEHLVGEVTLARPGWQMTCEGLAWALLVEALRKHGASSEGGAHGWLKGLADPEIGVALRMMHERPSHRWTVAELAKSLSVSRSAFAARFKVVTGRPPLDYLTWWRLHRAAARLRRLDGATIAMIAREAGYDSDASFGKAFRREFGKSPGVIRREVSAGTASPLQFELKKQRPFENLEQEIGLNMTKTAWQLQSAFVALFAAHGLDAAEFNVLRILRGVGAPVLKSEILARMVIPNANPDDLFATLGKTGLIKREKGANLYFITQKGNQVLHKIDEPLISTHRRQFAHFSPGELVELNRLLVKARRPDA